MCTIVAIKDRHPRYPLIVGANRDEYYARPSSGAQLVSSEPRIVAGLDLVKGGSWMGANEHGLFVAVTNQRSFRGADPRLSSRGEIVLEALKEKSARDVEALLASLDAREYNPFNLLFGDAEQLMVGYARHERAITVELLGEGVWVLANDRIGSPDFPKSERALELVKPIATKPWDELYSGLVRALGDHEKPNLDRIEPPPPGAPFDRDILRELQALCIHTPVYGTRSATVLAIEPGRIAHYAFADGPPCSTPFTDLTALLGSA